jgi:hypothetical protein
VGEVAADPITPSDDLRGREIGPAGQKAIFDVVVDPIADGLHPVEAVVDMTEMLPGKVQQFIGITVAAGQGVTQQRRRQLIHGHGRVPQALIIGQRRDANQGVVKKFVATRHERHAAGEIAVGIGEFIRRETGAKRERLRAHRLLSIEPRSEHEQDGGGHGSFVGDPAANPHGEIQ